METQPFAKTDSPNEKPRPGAKSPGMYELIKAGKTPSAIAGLLHSKRPRRQNVEVISQTNSDLNSIINRATKVFGDRYEAIRWLEMPIRALNHASPISLLGTREGAECVNDILGQIETGIWTEEGDPLSLWAE